MNYIYHILNDEKFSDWVIQAYSSSNHRKNIFILISDNGKVNHLKNGDFSVRTRNWLINEFTPNSKDIVIFYYLHLHSIKFLNKFSESEFKKVWVGYGSDYYYYLLNKPNFQSLYLKETNITISRLNKSNILKKILLPFYQFLFFKFKVFPALQALDYFAPVIPNEFKLIKKVYPDLKFKYLNFTFGDISYLKCSNNFVNGSNILLGNSATYTCNHIDVLENLSAFRISNRFVIPLGYGNQKYKELLLDRLPQRFKKIDFYFIDKFLPIKEYNELLNQCGFAIMPHLRQQAMGNIYALLYSGTKLFLFIDNPVSEFLKNLDVIFFDIESLYVSPSLLDQPLSREQMLHNRQVIGKYYSKENSYSKVFQIDKL
ncbi:TDP-N-acetylfucosamine:lipid II N-acetylfucosaminyltransferase [Cyclobacterium marinum]|uniref:TDP-N-acetylfucosamine:lipid II N-acetylfucosaminyltransferase n=1 Tax=Cyclobacterium marinum TaxID=104 RepID=UPI0030DA2670|tara:strand:+ start:48248 stop:49363 length:1116 start_codon:yes stop_codon:yes gene_type:complete